MSRPFSYNHVSENQYNDHELRQRHLWSIPYMYALTFKNEFLVETAQNHQHDNVNTIKRYSKMLYPSKTAAETKAKYIKKKYGVDCKIVLISGKEVLDAS